ncbi:MAG: ABC transporter ATP-binding protein/permease [Verrucomicrobia bacterium]|nr:ABC transporter ATP-binding protein/permease [Verrucomicrobiota bacterium]
MGVILRGSGPPGWHGASLVQKHATHEAGADTVLTRPAARRKSSVILDAWRIARPYWTSEERWSAWALLAAIVALNLGNVYISVRINSWNSAFYNALQSLNQAEFFRQLGIFCLLAALAIASSVYALYLNQMLQIRWRRWLTHRYLNGWLSDRAYYHLQLGDTTDNPDQRITEDLNQFTSYVLSLSLGLLSSTVSFASFLVILGKLSGPAAIPLGHWGTLHLPAYLVWAALLYAGAGTWATTKLGRPLAGLNFAQQRFEADLRYGLVRLRENAESVAFYGGEPAELGILQARFRSVFTNFWQIMKRQKRLMWFTSGYAQAAIIFPVVVVAPRYFAQQLSLGGLMQVISAFSAVQGALSFIITAYTDIAAWQAVTRRLSGFDERLRSIGQSSRAPQRIVLRRGGTGMGVEVQGLDLDLPAGRPLLRDVTFTVARGEALLITGPTGTGKSTLLRAAAGLWPFGAGRIISGQGRTLFLPQRPYLPLGTLAEALLYPAAGRAGTSSDQLVAALTQVGLGRFAAELDRVDGWAQRLSIGEQQRLAFARIFLTEPDLVFLDEATSALDEVSEAQLYQRLRAAPWRPAVVSVGHRSTLRAFHDRVLEVTDFGALSPEPLPEPKLEQSEIRRPGIGISVVQTACLGLKGTS